MSKRFFITLLAVAFIIGAIGNAFAVSSYVNSFTSTYPASATSSFSCSICHVPAGPPSRNAYGSAWASAGRNFRNIETADSDGDGFTNLAEITAGTNPGDSGSKPAPSTCSSFTYSAWGACQSNNTQTRTVASSLPAGCTGGTPVLSQACTYVPPTCSSFTYSAWGACQSNNTQTRTVASSSPAGCTGGTPVLSQACTYVPPVTACTSFTYSTWGACQSNNTQTRTVASSSPAGCTGGTPVLSQACTYVPPVTACTSFTYSTWGACQSNNTQTRTVASSSPAGCTGGTPVLSQACTYVPPVTACTSFTYSTWGACQSNNTQTRTVASSSPAGCTGGTPVLSQACTYVPPVTACTSFTYSAWSACLNSQQTRTVTGNTPAGCTGTPSTQPLLTQICNTPPPPVAKVPVPTSDHVFSYDAVELPIVSLDPDKAAPIGVGPAASGGDTIDVTVNVGPFSGPVNVSLVLYAPSLDSDQLFFMSPYTGLKKLSDALNEDNDDEHSYVTTSTNRISRLVNWKTNVTSVNARVIGPIDVSDVPSGRYTLVLVAKSPRNPDNFYRWITHLDIP